MTEREATKKKEEEEEEEEEKRHIQKLSLLCVLRRTKHTKLLLIVSGKTREKKNGCATVDEKKDIEFCVFIRKCNCKYTTNYTYVYLYLSLLFI